MSNLINICSLIYQYNIYIIHCIGLNSLSEGYYSQINKQTEKIYWYSITEKNVLDERLFRQKYKKYEKYKLCEIRIGCRILRMLWSSG